MYVVRSEDSMGTGRHGIIIFLCFFFSLTVFSLFQYSFSFSFHKFSFHFFFNPVNIYIYTAALERTVTNVVITCSSIHLHMLYILLSFNVHLYILILCNIRNKICLIIKAPIP